MLNKKVEKLALKRVKKSGIEEGKLSIIRNLLNSGMKLDEISKVTGLTKEDLTNVNSTNKHSTEELVTNVFNELFGIKLSISKNRRK